MASRGRKSAAEIAAPSAAVSVSAESRLQSPVHLSEAERQVWSDLISDQAASAFTVTHIPLLEMYCRHVVNHRILSEELLAFDRAWLADEDGLKRYDTLLKLAERESRAASSLATRLRITRQAVDAKTAGTKYSGVARLRKPWELGQ